MKQIEKLKLKAQALALVGSKFIPVADQFKILEKLILDPVIKNEKR